MGSNQAVGGRVAEELPSGIYKVNLDTGQIILGHPAGAKVRNFVRLLPGDRVEVVLTPHDWTRGRITRKVL
ncbi:MAG: translation initiation factor IF-1 [Bryobacteraceae bacterium]